MMKTPLIFACMVCALILSSTTVFADYGGGTGYYDNPFLIETAEQFNSIGLNPDHLSSHFILTADIDLSEYTGTEYNIIGTNTSLRFSGTFDGNGHVIKNLTYFAPDGVSYVGLFGYSYFGTIKNLGLEDVNISGNSANIGALLASGFAATIQNCWVTGKVTGRDSSQLVGGLAGTITMGTVENCWARVEVTGTGGARFFGGLIGMLSGTAIHCWTAGSVSCGPTGETAGGLVGIYSENLNDRGIEKCYSSCTVEVARYYAGGLIGKATTGPIRDCFAVGSVTGANSVGGFIGNLRPTTQTDTIVNCYSTGPVHITTSGNYAGGFFGYCEIARIIDCFSTGPVTGAEDSRFVGGFAGTQQSGKMLRCYSTGSVTTDVQSSYTGGFAGGLWANITEQCFSTGPVSCAGGSGSWSFGGFAGVQDGGAIYSCYSTSSVNSTANSRYTGGLVGYCGNSMVTVEKSFSAGPVVGGSIVGGLIGYWATGSMINTCMYDYQAAGVTNGPGKARDTAAMQNEATFTSAGWDFVGETANGTEDIWKMFDYPGFSWQNELAVDGDFSISLVPGQQGQLSFDIYTLTGTAIDWNIFGAESVAWITGVSQTAGTAAGPDAPTTVTIYVDSAGLPMGSTVAELTITGSNGDVIRQPVSVRIYDRIDMADFAPVTANWGTIGCDFGQPCKVADLYVDGVIDLKDLELFAQSWLAEDMQTVSPIIEEGFESGDFTALNFTHSGDAPWTVSTDMVETGTYSAKSGNIGNSQTTTLELTADTTGWNVNAVTFGIRPSTEQGFDFVRFYIDGELTGEWSGTWAEWLSPVYDVAAGVHIFSWTYMKDSSDSAGSDAAWIDNIRIFKK